jgi:hypothetical protein
LTDFRERAEPLTNLPSDTAESDLPPCGPHHGKDKR